MSWRYIVFSLTAGEVSLMWKSKIKDYLVYDTFEHTSEIVTGDALFSYLELYGDKDINLSRMFDDYYIIQHIFTEPFTLIHEYHFLFMNTSDRAYVWYDGWGYMIATNGVVSIKSIQDNYIDVDRGKLLSFDLIDWDDFMQRLIMEET